MLYDIIATCPVCTGELAVTRLRCGNCGTTIEGEFGVGRFASLTREQMQDLESFLRSRGNLRDMERELLISYPTVRGRVEALVRALGATGVNVFTNSGVDAGQTVPHVHLHVVPRYPGGDARRVFREADFEVTPMAEREQLASEVRKALADPAAHADEPRPG